MVNTESRRLFTKTDLDILSQTYMALFEYCHQKKQRPPPQPDVETHKPFSFTFNHTTEQNQSLNTSFDFSNHTFVPHDSIVQLIYVGADPDFDILLEDVYCERKCLPYYTSQWVCTDNTLPDFLNIEVAHLNCSFVHHQQPQKCILEYTIEYRFDYGEMFITDNEVLCITCCTLCCVGLVFAYALS